MEPELLTDELKRIVGHGVLAKRLPLMPMLRELSQVPDDASIRVATARIIRHLRLAVRSYPGGYQFRGKIVEPTKARIIYSQLLDLGLTGEHAEKRRSRVIVQLGGGISVGYWRGEPEWWCLYALAEHLCRNQPT